MGYYGLLYTQNGGAKLRDPGDGLTFHVDKTPAFVECTVGASNETRVLPSATSGNGIGVGTSLLVVLDVTSGGDLTVLDDAGNSFNTASAGTLALFTVIEIGGVKKWIGQQYLQGVTASATELNTLHSQTLATGAGAGITGGASTIYKNSVQKSGGIFFTRILIDLTSLQSSTTDLDIIGQSTTVAYIAKLTAAQCGTTILAVSMQCLEAPATGVTDIDLYSATEGTGKFDDLVTDLTETALITSGGAWTNGATKCATTAPLSTEYIYLTNGAAGTVGTYTAGKFLITILGY